MKNHIEAKVLYAKLVDKSNKRASGCYDLFTLLTHLDNIPAALKYWEMYLEAAADAREYKQRLTNH